MIDFDKLREIFEIALMFLPGLLIAITVHEFAHAWSASLLGDNFAKRRGRVSLNPLRHLSPLGTLAIFFIHFGWGKPVPVNLYNFKHPRRDYLLTSLAGPAANLIMLGICLGLLHVTKNTSWFPENLQPASMVLHDVLAITALINALLAFFNLIPIPPLDGSKIWPCLLPAYKPGKNRKSTWLFIIILIAVLYSGGLRAPVDFVLNNVLRIIPTPTGIAVIPSEQAQPEADYGDQTDPADKQDVEQ